MKKNEVRPLPIMGTSAFDEIVVQIAEISKLGEKIKHTRLKEKGVLLLLQHISGLPQGTIKRVLEALPELEKTFVKPE